MANHGRIFFAIAILLTGTFLVHAQNEQAPIVERDIVYEDWAYRSILNDEPVNLRTYASSNKLTIVVYFAPWCPNWRFDAPMLQRLYDKYRDKGLGIIAVGLYDPVDSMKENVKSLKVTFPAVYESADRGAINSSLHYKYRRSTGDARKWGSPWYILLPTSKLESKGNVLVRRSSVINGEMIESEGESFIRKELGLTGNVSETSRSSANKIEVCDPAQPPLLKKP